MNCILQYFKDKLLLTKYSTKNAIILLWLTSYLIIGCKEQLPEYVAVELAKLPEKVQFSIHVKPILSDKCYSCHGPDEATRKGGMRFDTEDGLYKKSTNGTYAFVSENLKQSEAIQRIISDDPQYIMPPEDAHLSLSSREKSILIKWVQQEAKWEKHWAFIVPKKTAPPKLVNNWPVENEIDKYIYKKLETQNLKPSEPTNKEQLLRRVTLDLTGLPPTEDELHSFLNDTSPNAYKNLVNKLLNSEAHAERLTLEWLDLARYSDSHGYHADGLRIMWPWRDWVINAFKTNKPYNEFVTEQIAGDLIENATKDQILATGFNRNHPMTAEGGAIDEEFRVDYVTNRTNTFGTAFLGLTMECAKCHDHKFDPISQADYFELFAFFNNNRELGMTFEDGNFGPLMLLSTDEEDKKINALSTKIDSLEQLHIKGKQHFLNIKNIHDSKAFKSINPVVYHSFEKINKNKKHTYLDNVETTTIGEEVELKEGFIGLSPNFDNQYDIIEIKNRDHFQLSDAFSVSIWVAPKKRAVEGTTSTIIGNSSIKGELYKGWDLHLDNKGYLSARLISVLPNNFIHVKTKDTIPLDSWTHILMTYDGSTHASGLNVYINGKETNQEVQYDRLFKNINPIRTKNIMIGKSPRGQSGDNGIYIGMLDELSIFDVEILPQQVESIYNTSKQGKKPMARVPNDLNFENITSALRQLRLDKVAVIEPIREMMVMEEMEPQRKTYILERGEYNRHGEEVSRGVPNKILPFSENYPKNRLGLSQWLFDKNNPLTARVAVNRYWQMIFGRGLVATANDFGNQGSMPSHPELLDWLAVDFMESNWNLRKLIRKMVMSNTYKQSSKTSTELRELDPNNELLARAPSYRLQAEFIRNNVLASSGLLNKKVGGESVKPYQPEGLWIAGNFSQALAKYVQDHDDKQYRRSMYTFIKRTAPPPYMTIFDMPTRDICIVSREQTNTPLQALSLLNDPQFVEAAKALAFRMKNEGGKSIEKQLQKGFELAISRNPNPKELEILKNLYFKELKAFEKDEEKALDYLSVGDYKIPKEFKPSEMATLTMVANTLFNMDEMYTKR
jgi:hypothetical protein